MDPENYTVFEIGRPAPGCEGWYVKVLLRRKHIMFGGLGTTSTNSEAYRLARVAMWNVNQDTAKQFCVQRFSKEASVLSIQAFRGRSEEHTSELQSLMRISYAVFCLKKNTT